MERINKEQFISEYTNALKNELQKKVTSEEYNQMMRESFKANEEWIKHLRLRTNGY